MNTIFNTKFSTDLKTLTLQQIKTNGAKAIPDDDIGYLIVNSKLKWATVPIETYEMMVEALEELEDIKAIEERKGDPIIPAEEVYADLLGND